jgi:hypothetical protein
MFDSNSTGSPQSFQQESVPDQGSSSLEKSCDKCSDVLAPDDTAETPSAPPLEATYAAPLTPLQAWEMWEALDTTEKCEAILTTYEATHWLDPEPLGILTTFRHTPPGRWEQIKLQYKLIGGNPFDLQHAVDAHLQEQATQAGLATPSEPSRPKLLRISARLLKQTTYPELVEVVDDVLPAGCTVLTGKSKDGKSMMAYNLAVAVASGGKALGQYNVQAGSVWYMALEDGERRTKARLEHMEAQMGELSEAAQDRLTFTCWEAPRLGEGLEDEIREWITTTPDARLIIIDILEKVRPLRKLGGNVYGEDYAATAPISRLAQEHNVAILIVHHANKLNPTDFRDTASGAMSLIGGADNFWSLSRMPMQEEATLRITGRDIRQECDLAMQFRDGYWTVLGDAATTVINPAHQAIIDALRMADYPMTPKQLATVLPQTDYETLKVHLGRLVQRGLLVRDNGHYRVRIVTPEPEPDHAPPRVTPVTVLPTEEPEPPRPAAEAATAMEPPTQPTPLMDTPVCTPAVREETPAPVLWSNRVTEVTPATTALPQASKDELIFRSSPTNGLHRGQTKPRTRCHHVWHTAGEGVRCTGCGVHHPGRLT